VFEKKCRKTGKICNWKVVEMSVPEKPVSEFKDTGVRFDFEHLSETPATDLIFHLWPGHRKEHIRNLNAAIECHNETADAKRVVGPVAEREFATFIAILMAPTVYGRVGPDLWKKPPHDSIVKIGASAR
jgi:hypothetical protein